MSHPFDRAHYHGAEPQRSRLRELGPPILAAVLSLVVTWWLLGWIAG